MLKISTPGAAHVIVNRQSFLSSSALKFKTIGETDWTFGVSNNRDDLFISNRTSHILQSFTQNGNVGIGIVEPEEMLHVLENVKVEGTVFTDVISSNSPLKLQTGGQDRIYIDDNYGRVGIGTSDPNTELEVFSTSDPFDNSVDISINREDNSRATSFQFNTDGEMDWVIFTPVSSNDLVIGNGTIPVQTMLQNGNIGVGMWEPEVKFDVDGIIRASSTIQSGNSNFISIYGPGNRIGSNPGKLSPTLCI